MLTPARRVFEAFDYEGTIKEIEPIIKQLDERRLQDAAILPKLAEALELRARARFLMDDVEGAKRDIGALLQVMPSFTIAPGAKVEYESVFNDLRRTTVAELAVTLEPEDAALELDGRALQNPGVLTLVHGTHQIVVSRRGYRSDAQTLVLDPGVRRELRVVLERVSAVLRITTVPSNVEVLVNGVRRGTTQPMRPPPGEMPLRESAPLWLTDLRVAPLLLEFRAPCHIRENRRYVVDALKDFVLEPVILRRADADIEVDTDSPGATILLDGEDQGSAPKRLRGICEGPHTLQVRSDTGLFVKRLEIRAGQNERVLGRLRPAFALLPAEGIAEDRGLDHEQRLGIERALEEVGAVTFFVPPAVQAESALNAAQVPSGWLAVDRTGRPLGAAAEGMSNRTRREAGLILTRALGVQGIASVNRGPGRDEVVLALLAAGSGEPDALVFNPDDPESLRRARETLSFAPALFRPSAGLTAIDVLGQVGAVVAEVEPNGSAAEARLAPGDLITQAAGEEVADAAGLYATLARAGDGQQVAIQVKRGTATSASAIVVQRVPSLVAPTDRTMLFNKMLVELRARRPQVPDEREQAQIALHIAVALMYGGSWAEARSELESARLPPGPGVSRGTVLYLTGLCDRALGRIEAAAAAWSEALKEAGSLLTPEGPPIAALVSGDRGGGDGR